MNPTPPPEWTSLFDASGPSGNILLRHFRVLYRRGQPFLVLPDDPGLARTALALYQPQSAKARLAKLVFRTALALGFSAGAKRERAYLHRNAALVKFLVEVAAETEPPVVAVLAGNPHTPGRRFVVLVFDRQGRPCAVVKAGCTSDAAALIEREAGFLREIPAGTPGIPVLRSDFRVGTQAALALDFIAGGSPAPGQEARAVKFLERWIQRELKHQLASLSPWRRLAAACEQREEFAGLARKLGGQFVTPVIQHGDFAPWNLKQPGGGGDWLALDWERGERRGVPAWDWFHFVLQPAILVRRESVNALVTRAERLLEEPAFARYAAATGITGFRHELLLAYLLYVREVLQPSEGLDAIRQLHRILAPRWG